LQEKRVTTQKLKVTRPERFDLTAALRRQ
jgi:hypothetical protein